jgi:large subunit ribosomal protein L24
MPVSKVMLVCPRCDRPTRVIRREHEGSRVRYCRRCGELIDQK